ncbi:hypothetical protein OEZ85_006497 [Tetradesmus obliquus]|uniref:Zinc transporter ZupT n=1 Tax=Tetradesmus obliquus TaxID=3088 RepID=A0ABY8TX87_TETOB|nr:hypothetical protein OEZ85_006497 [Tetradesmus obliquus]
MVFVSLTEVLGDALTDLQSGGLSRTVSHAVAYAAFFGGVVLCGALDLVTDLILDVVDVLSIAAGGSGSTDEIIVDVSLQDAAAAMKTSDELQLERTSLLIALALGFHNLPEGLATFVGYMSSPHLGITIAIAIAVHNLPEGIAVGVPVYFATGSRAKAIWYAAISGMAEPLGALIGLAVHLSGALNLVAMGIIMSLVSGIMTGIAFRELIPRALQYDPRNRYAAHGIFAGMGIMALSLLLLGLL